MNYKSPWVPMSKDAVGLLPNNRGFTELEALYSLQLNHNNRNPVSLRGLAKSWGWTHKKVRCFLPRVGVKIMYPQETSNIKNQRGYITQDKQIITKSNEGHNQGHKEGTINFIDFNKLGDDRGTKGAQSGAPINENREENKKHTSVSKDNHIPFEEIKELYHRILPELPRVKFFTDKRKRMVKARWSEDKKRQSLKWWEGYFNHVRKSDLYMGRATKWHANFEWLLNKTNFIKVLEGVNE